MLSISLITIGNELLRGRIVNTNAAKAGQLLRKNGYSLTRTLSISDTKEAILDAVEAELKISQVVILSGGLGPTKDDITKHTLAEWSESEWIWHQPTLDFLEERYTQRKRSLTELTRKQALVPSKCEVIHNPNGTAPGMQFSSGKHILFSLPGVPFEMLHLLEYEVIPRAKSAFPSAVFRSKVIRVSDIPESGAAHRLEALEDTFPDNVQLSYLPRHDGLWLELSVNLAQGKETEAEALLEKNAEKIENLMWDKIYAEGDHPIAEELARVMKEKKLSLAVAESLTGGSVSAKIVEISGASSFYKGSITAYDVQVKMDVLGVPPDLIEKNGVVSAEVAEAMAIGVKKLLKADIGLGTTGLAEDDGEIKAHAFLGFAHNSSSDAREVRLLYSRKVNIERCSNNLIQWCLKKVRESLD